MSNRNEVIDISSSSSDIISKGVPTTPDVPNTPNIPITPRPTAKPSRKRLIKWSRDYKNYWKKQNTCQRKIVIVISSSSSSSSTESEEEPEEDPNLKSDADSHKASDDAILERDPKPSTSESSTESRVG